MYNRTRVYYMYSVNITGKTVLFNILVPLSMIRSCISRRYGWDVGNTIK